MIDFNAQIFTVRQEHLQYTMGLLVDESGDTLDTTTAGQTAGQTMDNEV